MRLFKGKRFYFYPGEGGGEPNNGGSSADGGEGDHQDQLDNQNQQRPKYLDQVSPAKRDRIVFATAIFSGLILSGMLEK